jgi:hypothetical protein
MDMSPIPKGDLKIQIDPAAVQNLVDDFHRTGELTTLHKDLTAVEALRRIEREYGLEPAQADPVSDLGTDPYSTSLILEKDEGRITRSTTFGIEVGNTGMLPRQSILQKFALNVGTPPKTVLFYQRREAQSEYFEKQPGGIDQSSVQDDSYYLVEDVYNLLNKYGSANIMHGIEDASVKYGPAGALAIVDEAKEQEMKAAATELRKMTARHDGDWKLGRQKIDELRRMVEDVAIESGLLITEKSDLLHLRLTLDPLPQKTSNA